MLGQIHSEAVMKTFSLLLSLINTLIAVLIMIFNISTSIQQYTGLWNMLLQNITIMTVIFFGVITWFASMTDSNNGAVLLGSIALIITGTVYIVWAYHLTVVGGQVEFFLAGFGASLTLQGLSSLLGFSIEAGHAMA
jgi:hypothetical protein